MAKEDQCIGQQIVFRQFFVPISVAVGSTESIEFLESISTSENKKFF